MTTPARSTRLDAWRRPLGFAVLCGAVGVVASLVLFWIRGGWQGYETFPAYAGAAAFLAGGLVWRVLFRGGRSPSVGRGALAGVVASILGHELTWLLAIEVANFQYWVLGRKVGSLHSPPVGPIQALWASWVYAAFSLFVLGWFTVPCGAVLGALFAWGIARARPGARAAGPG